MKASKPEESQSSDRYGRRADLKYALHLLRRNPIVLAGVTISVASVLLALLSPLIVNPTSWNQQPLNLRLCWNNPIVNWQIANVFNCGGSAVYPLGTDSYGRSLLQMIILAIPVDLEIAFEVVGHETVPCAVGKDVLPPHHQDLLCRDRHGTIRTRPRRT